MKSKKSVHFFSSMVLLSFLLLFSTEGNSYCHDRAGEPNVGFCTRDPDYHGGAYACLPGGYTCDGDDIFA